MNYRKSIAAAALALAVAASPVAFAKQRTVSRQQQQQSFLTLFTRADLNRDGVVTRAEAERFARTNDGQRALRRLDRNGDGVITRSEWRGDRNTFARLDRNRDGVLSAADRIYRTSRYRGLDRNRDGVVTRTEWRGRGSGSWQLFNRLDTNDDGRLSGWELQ